MVHVLVAGVELSLICQLPLKRRVIFRAVLHLNFNSESADHACRFIFSACYRDATGIKLFCNK